MRFFLLLLFLCSNFFAIAQSQYNGIVRDIDTDLELPYVNIGVLNKGVGTVTNEAGKFSLFFDFRRISKLDTLQISSVGYKTIKKAVGDLDFQSANDAVIQLTPDVFGLDEVVLSPDSQQLRQRKVGYYISKSKKIGYWRGGTSLGAEMVTKIKVTKRPRQLNEFSFKVLKNLSDSLRLRVNVYRGDTSFPQVKLNKQNIFYMLTKKAGVVNIDLTPYEIYVADDFSIGLELINVYGKRIDLTLLATYEPGTSYRRYASHDEWHRYRNDALAFTVNTTIYDKDGLEAQIGEDVLYGEQRINTMPNKITGLVFNKGKALVNVDVRVEGKDEATSTDENGRYSINASLGDVITYNFLNMETVSRKVLETTFGINVSMQVKVTELDGVTVTDNKRIRKTQEKLFLEYNNNPNLIKTSFGILDKLTSGVDLYILDEGEFRSTSINILEAVSGKFPGVRIADRRDPNYTVSAYDLNAVLYGRGGGSILNKKPMVYEIDGVLETEVPRHINMDNVKRIAVLPGLAANSKYGNIASGGLVIINRKVTNYSPRKNGIPNDPFRVKDNIYKNDAITQQQVTRNWPNYLQSLNASRTYDEAKEIFENYRKNFSSSPYFLIDSYLYFKQHWKNKTEIDDIVSPNSKVFDTNIPALTGLGYAFEKTGELKRAELVYKKLFKLKPNHPQSYLNLARVYSESGLKNKSIRLFAQYNYLLNQEFLNADTEGSHSIIQTEFNNLTRLANDSIAKKTKAITNIDVTPEIGTRIVLDWNEPKAEFEVQFVNPKNRYFTWSNTPALAVENGKEIIFSKEYFIDDYMVGDWLVNVNYKGAITSDPMYMKATIFYDYGLPSQRSEVELFRLHLKNVNQQLITLQNR